MIFCDTAWGFRNCTAMNPAILFSRDVDSLIGELVAYSEDEYQVYFQSTVESNNVLSGSECQFVTLRY